MSIVDLASTSFGQSVRITPLQLISGVCAIANGGKLMKPYLVAGVADSEGNITEKTEPVVRRTVISESTSKTVRSMMQSVVSEGTGKNAYIEGYRVAGKTGTAQKLDSGTNTYIASFVAFAPADAPEVAVLIGVDSPQGYVTSGGALAAPVAKEVLASTLEYLDVKPEYTEDELKKISTTAPSFEGKALWEAKNLAASIGIRLKISGQGEDVISQYPAAGQFLPSGGVVVIYTDMEDKNNETVVPDFTGKSVAEANILAAESSLNIIFSGPTDEGACVAYAQSLEKGSVTASGSSITVYFANKDIRTD